MIYVEYTEDGQAISDFNYESWLGQVKGALARATINNAGYDTKFKVSTSIPISALRLAICSGEINSERIAFIYKNKIFQANERGRIKDWPDGFADVDGKLATKILTRQRVSLASCSEASSDSIRTPRNLVNTPMSIEHTCACGLYVHPSRRNPAAIHIKDCPYH